MPMKAAADYAKNRRAQHGRIVHVAYDAHGPVVSVEPRLVGQHPQESWAVVRRPAGERAASLSQKNPWYPEEEIQ